MHSVKVVLSIVLLLCVIIVSSTITHNLIKNTSENIENHVSKIEENIKFENWQEIDNQLSVMQDNWEKTEKLWTVLIDHFEIDNIDISLARMAKYIEAKDTPSALAEAGALKLLIRHIPDKESLNLKNIF